MEALRQRGAQTFTRLAAQQHAATDGYEQRKPLLGIGSIDHAELGSI
jgi:hypothetical protein